MRIVILLIGLFVGFIGLMALLVGVGYLPPLLAYPSELLAGREWNGVELAKRLVRFTGPTYLGLGMMVGMAFLVRYVWRLDALQKRFPDQPWLSNPQWAKKHIRLSNRPAVIALLLLALFFLLVMVPGGMVMAAIKLKAGIYAFVGVFGLILFGLARLAWTNRRWNRSELKLATLPGVIGGPFSAVALIPESFPPGTAFRVALRCEETVVRRSGKDSHSETNILWQDEHILDRPIDSARADLTALPVHFAVPYESEPSEAHSQWRSGYRRSGSRRILWWVVVSLKEESDPREAKFLVPVFRTAESSPNYRADPNLLDPYLEDVDSSSVLKRLPIVREPLPEGGERIRISIYRGREFRLGCVVGLVCAAMVAAILRYAWGSPLMLFALLPGFVSVAVIVGLAEMLFWSTTIDLSGDRIEVTAGLRGFEKHHSFPRGGGLPLGCFEDYKKSKGAWWNVTLARPGEKAIPLIKRLDGRQEAEAMRDWLRGLVTPKR